MAKKINFGNIAVNAAGAAAGGAGVLLVNKFLPNLNPLIRGGAQVLLGAALTELVPAKGNKPSFVAAAGQGMIGAAVVKTAENLFPAFVSGVDDIMNGADEPIYVDAEYADDVSGIDDVVGAIEDDIDY
jgi:hypothetical protein